jgi:hypothetical protein
LLLVVPVAEFGRKFFSLRHFWATYWQYPADVGIPGLQQRAIRNGLHKLFDAFEVSSPLRAIPFVIAVWREKEAEFRPREELGNHRRESQQSRLEQGKRLSRRLSRANMKSVWRKHLIILSALGLLAVPIYFLDLASSGGGGGNWITLDFRGFIFWTYATWFAIHIVLSSIAVQSFPQSGLLRIHFGSMVLSLILLAAGFVAYGKLLRAFSIDGLRWFSC